MCLKFSDHSKCATRNIREGGVKSRKKEGSNPRKRAHLNFVNEDTAFDYCFSDPLAEKILWGTN